MPLQYTPAADWWTFDMLVRAVTLLFYCSHKATVSHTQKSHHSQFSGSMVKFNNDDNTGFLMTC